MGWCLWAGAYLPKGLRFYFYKKCFWRPCPQRGGWSPGSRGARTPGWASIPASGSDGGAERPHAAHCSPAPRTEAGERPRLRQVHRARGVFSQRLLVASGLRQGQLASHVWLTWIWDGPALWPGFLGLTMPGGVDADRRSVSCGHAGASASGKHWAPSTQTGPQCLQDLLGGASMRVKGEEKMGRSFLYVADG